MTAHFPLKPPYKIMIVDDHKFVVELLAQRLTIEPKIEVVGMVNRGRGALEIAEKGGVDIILLDMELDQEDGIQVARSLFRIDRNFRIIGLSMHDEDHHPISLLEIGGVGFLSKSASAREIVDGVLRVANGEMAISPKIAVHLATQCQNPSPIDQVRTLSRQESKVLRLIAEGHTVKKMAETLEVTDKTIQGHRANLRKKLEVDTDVELCLIALKSGIVGLHD